MKKLLGLTFLLLGFVYQCIGQSKEIMMEKRHILQPHSDSTSNLLIIKGRAHILPITMILDDRDTFVLLSPRIAYISRVSYKTFLLKNIPKGDHKVFVSSNKFRRFKDSLNYTFHFQADGNRKTVLEELPKLRYNDTIQFFRGIGIAIEATIASAMIYLAAYGGTK